MGIFDNSRYRNIRDNKTDSLDMLNEKTDLLFMMEFRQRYWDEWVEFCHERGFEAEVENGN